MSLVRINKYLSVCGVTSRRGAETLISEKRVTANDITVTELGAVIDPETDVVKVDGVVATPVEKKVYVALNKTRMTMTTLHDPFKRRTIVYYLGQLEQRVYPVGRLDFDAEGLLLLTNDGDLAYRLAHPRYQVPKIYEARVQGQFTREAADRIQGGIVLDDGATGRAEVSILGFVSDSTRIRLTLTEGRKHEVKQLCKKVGHPVTHLRRVEFAGLNVRSLKPGQWRYLTPSEVDQLRALVGLDS
jgi:23S rRNA pseudouridine2605 synthase